MTNVGKAILTWVLWQGIGMRKGDLRIKSFNDKKRALIAWAL